MAGARRSSDRGGRPSRPPPALEVGRLPPCYARGELETIFGPNMLPRRGRDFAPNAGLVFDRFLRIWDSESKLVTERNGPLQLFVSEYEGLREPLGPLLASVHSRLGALSGPDGTRQVTTQERLVSGLGAAHPLENGFCFEYTLGVPHLLGSSVKGLARTIAELELDEGRVAELFGAGDDEPQAISGSSQVGDIVFLPAYPERWPRLDVDVINCHQSNYYGSSPLTLDEAGPQPNRPPRRIGPLEVQDPVPVFFLAVAKGERFIFRCLSRTSSRANVHETLDLICAGLQTLGIGAKTALGYGVMGDE